MSAGGAAAAKGSLVVRNVGTIVTGDLANPIATGDTIVVRDGVIASVGSGAGADGIAKLWGVLPVSAAWAMLVAAIFQP